MGTFDTAYLVSHMLDRFPLGLLFLITVLVLLVLIEIGFQLGSRARKRAAKAQHSQVRAIMGATLGLLAFMLAFTFAVAQGHYETRVQNMVEEVRLAGNAFLQAEFLEEPYRTRARQTLHEYVSDRVRLSRQHREGASLDLGAAIEKSELLQAELWHLGVQNERLGQAPGQTRIQRDPFLTAVISLIDIHSMRLQAAFMNRISWAIWVTLYMTAMLSMLVMGYQAGLVEKRSPLATMTLAVAFAAVMMLITDLDRPIMSMFQINDQIMVELVERMEAML